MSNFNIVDNFLPEEDFKIIQAVVMSAEFPWYYNNKIIAEEMSGKYQFTHSVYRENNSIQSNFFELFRPIIKVLDPKMLIRMKINMGGKTEDHEKGGWHIDQEIQGSRTAVLYFNNNNGYTLFEDGTKVESLENRFASFDNTTRHTGVSQTDTQVRCVLNINYIPYEYL